jgi:hypothetical protein
MTVKSGWLRLWIVTATLYLAVVAVMAWSTLPTPESVQHKASFYSQIPPEARARILNTQPRSGGEQDFIRDAANAKGVVLAEMPNGHTLVFRDSLKRTDMDASAKAYWEVVESTAAKERSTYIWLAIAWWVLPLIAIYMLGWAAGWVYRGFRGT